MGSCQNQLGTQSNQGHLMDHWKNLPSTDKRRTFQQQLNQINLAKTVSLYKRSSTKTSQLSNSISSDKTNTGTPVFQPLPEQLILHKSQIIKQKSNLDNIGLQAIHNGQVAVFLMSGNHNPSLNINFPLGMYDLGTDSACQIFQLMIYKLIRLNYMTGGFQNKKIKLYIMTSSQNKEQIKKYFKSKNYFNYGANNVFFFSQSSQPVVDENGKIMLKTQSQIYTSPRGNGTIFAQIKDKNLLQHLRNQGIKYVYFGPINNILMKISSPTLLGCLIRENQQVVATCVNSYDDCLGYFGLNQNNKQIVVSEEGKCLPVKKWAFTGSSFMTIQFLSLIINNNEFMQKIRNQYKAMVKQALVFNPTTNTRDKTKCVFFENFYHEAFGLANKIKIIEVDQKSQFAPIRNNGQGKYSINFARNALWNWHRFLLQSNGVSFIGEGHVQIHPGLTYEGENIQKLINTRHITTIKLPQFIR